MHMQPRVPTSGIKMGIQQKLGKVCDALATVTSVMGPGSWEKQANPRKILMPATGHAHFDAFRQCGVRPQLREKRSTGKPKTSIVNAVESQPNSWPWQVSLRYKTLVVCKMRVLTLLGSSALMLWL